MHFHSTGTALKSAIDLISVPVFVVDLGRDGLFRIAALNAAHCSVTGMCPTTSMGATPHQLLASPTDAQSVIERYQRCISLGQPISYRESLTVNQQVMVFDTSLHPISRDAAPPRRIVGTALRVAQSGANWEETSYFVAQLQMSLTMLEQLMGRHPDGLGQREREAAEILIRGAQVSAQQMRRVTESHLDSPPPRPVSGLARAQAEILLN